MCKQLLGILKQRACTYAFHAGNPDIDFQALDEWNHTVRSTMMSKQTDFQLPEALQGVIANHLLYSFEPVTDYQFLTDDEKRIFTRSQYEELLAFLDSIKEIDEFES